MAEKKTDKSKTVGKVSTYQPQMRSRWLENFAFYPTTIAFIVVVILLFTFLGLWVAFTCHGDKEPAATASDWLGKLIFFFIGSASGAFAMQTKSTVEASHKVIKTHGEEE
jgi:hypothetical protein